MMLMEALQARRRGIGVHPGPMRMTLGFLQNMFEVFWTCAGDLHPLVGRAMSSTGLREDAHAQPV